VVVGARKDKAKQVLRLRRRMTTEGPQDENQNREEREK
jgi:hypothetical protein